MTPNQSKRGGGEAKPSAREGERDLNGNLRHRRDAEPAQARGAASADLFNPDTFLSEDALVRLALSELNGRLPPGFGGYGDRKWNGLDESRAGVGHSAELPRQRKTVLAHELETRGWTARELAHAAGFTQSEAVALLRGNVRITAEVARKLAKAFATSEDFWL